MGVLTHITSKKLHAYHPPTGISPFKVLFRFGHLPRFDGVSSWLKAAPMDLPDLRAVLPPLQLQQRLLAMLQWIDERLSCANVTYWITGGTLLGALRHQGGLCRVGWYPLGGILEI